MNKKLMILSTALLAAAVALGAPKKKNAAQADDDAPTSGKEAKVLIVQFPKLGGQALLGAPSLQGGSIIGQCYTKPRRWIVLETKYSTFAKWQDQLTFTWHVLLDSKTASENKGNKEGLAPYSYFTTSTTYQNIPQGSHAASVCLHPSYLELYGEPKAIGIVITNSKGEVLNWKCESEIKGIPSMAFPKPVEGAFWNNQEGIMNAKKDGKPMIESRQGLMDRSKTIWGLVNPNDYEQVAQ